MPIKIYNRLPTQIKETTYDPKQFRRSLNSFLFMNSFYTLQEYFNHDKYDWFFLFVITVFNNYNLLLTKFFFSSSYFPLLINYVHKLNGYFNN
jgi:hypothetical protein